MSEFDPIRAIGEEIAGLVDIHRTLLIRQRSAEEEMGRAEAELNAVTKLIGFASTEIERKRGVMEQLVAKKRAEEKR